MSSPPGELTTRRAPLVCVVDPDPAVRGRVGALLRALGADVEAFASAREFLARLPSVAPTCLIAERHLPDLPGIALLQELQARGLRIPTILMSSDADVGDAVEAMRAGALDYIEKPLIDRLLVAQVAPILDLDGHRAH